MVELPGLGELCRSELGREAEFGFEFDLTRGHHSAAELADLADPSVVEVVASVVDRTLRCMAPRQPVCPVSSHAVNAFAAAADQRRFVGGEVG